MSTGYSWKGIRQVRATLLGARHVYLSASEVAMSTWGAISSARPFFTEPTSPYAEYSGPLKTASHSALTKLVNVDTT